MKPMEPAMNFVSRERPKAERKVSLQPGMLEAMIKRLYIRRFPQLDDSAQSFEETEKRAVEKKRAAKVK